MFKRIWLAISILSVLAVALAACGDSDPADTGAGASDGVADTVADADGPPGDGQQTADGEQPGDGPGADADSIDAGVDTVGPVDGDNGDGDNGDGDNGDGDNGDGDNGDGDNGDGDNGDGDNGDNGGSDNGDGDDGDNGDGDGTVLPGECPPISIPAGDAGGASTPASSTPPALGSFPSSTHSVESREFTSVPVTNGYNYDVTVYWPNETPAVARPMVIFEHGFQLAASDFPRYGETLARYGFIAVLPSTKDTGGFIPSSRDHNLLAEDIGFVIDWALAQNANASSPLRGRIDPCLIGAGGHSRGGKATIWAAILDDRIRASWNIDPVDAPPQGPGGIGGTSPSVTPDRMSGFTIPGAFIGTGLGPVGGGPISPACAPDGENYEDFFQSAAGPAFSFVLTESGHNDFVERCHGQSGGIIPNECTACAAGDYEPWIVDFTVLHQVAFYKVFLAGDATFRPWVDGAPIRGMGGFVDNIRWRNALD